MILTAGLIALAPPAQAESAWKAIAWPLTGGKMGEKGDDALMGDAGERTVFGSSHAGSSP